MGLPKKINKYRKIKEEGRLGSRKEHTWNKRLHIHICCKSKQPWYHKKNCPALEDKFSKIQLKSQEKKAVNDLREKGMNSLEVAKTLNIELSKVNMLWN